MSGGAASDSARPGPTPSGRPVVVKVGGGIAESDAQAEPAEAIVT